MVRSIDMQQVLLQSNAVERVQQVQQQQADVQQRHFKGQLAEEKRELREKVKTLEEAERIMIKEKEGRDKREKKRKQADADEAARDLIVDETAGKVDIRV
jgi:predicted phage gp36 major capsid-like protein